MIFMNIRKPNKVKMGFALHQNFHPYPDSYRDRGKQRKTKGNKAKKKRVPFLTPFI
jgi:hypothetical protein